MESAELKIKVARNRIVSDYQMLIPILLSTKIEEDKSIPTACTNGYWIKYNSDFIDKLTRKQTLTVLAHEFLHIMLAHHIRRENRENTKYNIAADYVVNLILIKEMKLESIPDMLYSEEYINMSVESVYNKLPDPPKNQGSGSFKGDIGGVEDAPAGTSKSEETARVKELIAQASSLGKLAGDGKGLLERQLFDIIKPTVPWKRHIARWITEKAKTNYNWLKRNRRIRQFYFPSLDGVDYGTIVVGIDVSGSVYPELLNQFFSELNALKRMVQFKCIVIFCDYDIQEVLTFQKHEQIKINSIPGGGGTRFSPVFEWVEKNSKKIAGLVYFTDLYADLKIKKPSYPVLWLTTNESSSIKIPFGDKVIMGTQNGS